MRFVSTRGADADTSSEPCAHQGDRVGRRPVRAGTVPTIPTRRFRRHADLAAVAETMLGRFRPAMRSHRHSLRSVTRLSIFAAPLVPLKGSGGSASVLELFHGPTCAFKDFGARFLAAALERHARACARQLTVLVGNVRRHRRRRRCRIPSTPWSDVVLLYPKGLVSARQAQQLSCWGDNVRTFAVHGTFDDCQAMVKDAIRDPGLTAAHEFSSANSINLGRLLPQTVVLRAASSRFGGGGSQAELHRSVRQPRQRRRVCAGPRHGVTDRRHRARDQREPHDYRLSDRRDVASADERRHAGLGDGRR